MTSIVRTSTDERRRRSPAATAAAVEELHSLGYTRSDIAERLNLTPGASGSLARALQRAGRHDLLAAITPPDWHEQRHEAGLRRWMEERVSA